MSNTWGKLIGFGFGFWVILAFSLSPVMAQDVEKIYKKRCEKCHGVEGKGDGKTLVKMNRKAKKKGKKEVIASDWSDKAAMAKLTDEYLLDIIVKGGKKLKKSKRMPSYKKKLSAEEAKALADYVRTFAK